MALGPVTAVTRPSYRRDAADLNVPLSNGSFRLKLVSITDQSRKGGEGEHMSGLFRRLWSEDEGQDIAEYAVMLAVILVIVVGTVRLIGGNSNNVFSSVSSSIGS